LGLVSIPSFHVIQLCLKHIPDGEMVREISLFPYYANVMLTNIKGKRKKSSRKPQGPKKASLSPVWTVILTDMVFVSVNPLPPLSPAYSAITRKQ
jgi:hypothetical protein